MVAFATDPQTERSLLRSAGRSRDGGGAVSSSRPRPCCAGIGSSRVASGSGGEPCEALGVPRSTMSSSSSSSDSAGRTVVRSHVTRGVRAYRPPADARATLELAVELVRAESADHDDDPVRARCLAIGEEESPAWAEQLWGSFRDLVAGWPRFEEAWWPRTEEPAKVALGTGTVVLSGRFDIVLGGAPTR